jgi:hypothetical protein
MLISIWVVATKSAKHVDFDLGGGYKVSKAAIWSVSVKELAVQVASSTNGPWQDAGQFNLSDQQSSLSLRATVMDFGMELQGRYVRLEILSEYPATLGGSFGYVTIGEVVLRAAAVGQSPMAIRSETNGDVTITFTGVLQSGNDLKGSFEDVPGNPQGVYTVPEASLAALQYLPNPELRDPGLLSLRPFFVRLSGRGAKESFHQRMKGPIERPAFGLELSADEERMSLKLQGSGLVIFGTGDDFKRGSFEEMLVVRTQPIAAMIALHS